MIVLHGIPGGVLGRDGPLSFPYSQHDSFYNESSHGTMGVGGSIV